MWNLAISRAWRNTFRTLKRDIGSVILETAVILPVFICFLLVIINFINVASIYLGMDHAVGETVKQLAAHAAAYRQVDKNLGALGSFEPLVRQGAAPMVDGLIETAVRHKIKSYYPLSELQDEDFTVSNVTINEEAAVTVVYRVRLAIPFFSRELNLANTAVERVW